MRRTIARLFVVSCAAAMASFATPVVPTCPTPQPACLPVVSYGNWAFLCCTVNTQNQCTQWDRRPMYCYNTDPDQPSLGFDLRSNTYSGKVCTGTGCQ